MKTIRFLLFPFAILYDGITSVRNLFYDKGIFKSTSFDIPVVAVGNLNVGGTGKSPQIEYLIRLFEKKKVAVLSRGYKRRRRGFILINDTHSANDVGDEPVQFYKNFSKVFVAVDENRVNGIQRLIKDVNPDIILLDDAFQHRKVNARLYVLLTKYDDLYTQDFLLPTGNLRESRKGAKRANLIVVTKCPNDISEEKKSCISQKLKLEKNQQLFFSKISYAQHVLGDKTIAVSDLNDYKILLITGIANPVPLTKFLKGQKCNFEHLKFFDHHHFSKKEIEKIQQKFEQIDSKKKILLTTEKDYVRLEGKLSGLTYLPIQTEFLENQKDLDSILLTFFGNKK